MPNENTSELQSFPITLNFSKANTKRKKLDGKDYLVVPMAMLAEGVLNGNNGPTLYPKEEVQKFPNSWNMKPLVIYHPTHNGQGISACDPDVIEARGVGLIMNARYTRGKLRADAYIDEEKLAKVDDRVSKSIEQNQLVEISTGLFTDTKYEDGEFDGKPYSKIATNFRPDHLAILPDEKGAYSVEQGAGLFQTNSKELPEELQELISNKIKESVVESFEGIVANKQEPNGKESDMSQVTELATALIANEATAWTEEDKDTLLAMDESTLEKMTPIEVTPEPKEEPKEKVEENPEALSEGTPSVEEYLANAPSEIKATIESGIVAHNKAKKEHVDVIVANKSNTFSVEFLNTKSLEELEGLAALAAVPEAPKTNSNQPVPMFQGNAGGPISTNTKVQPLLAPDYTSNS